MKLFKYFVFIFLLLIQSCSQNSYKPNQLNAISCDLFSSKQEYLFDSKGNLFYYETENKIKPLIKKIISESGINNHVKEFASELKGDILKIKIKTYFENISNQELHETVDKIHLKKKILISTHKHGNNAFQSKGRCKFIPYKSIKEVSKWS
tara:strand:- start:113 stop:565 length:453 start_codon:yes stop_codon:yes gene_type:complete